MGLVHKQRVLDLDAELRHKGETVVVRVVCVPFGGEDRYYMTTLPRADFSPHDVAEFYRLRWEVELFFRGLKGAVRLDEVRRLENEQSLHSIVYASLLAATLAQDITAKLNELETIAYLPDDANASTEAFPPGADEVGRPRGPETAHPQDLLRRRLAARARLSSNPRPSARDQCG